jgi:hypothetical protein
MNIKRIVEKLIPVILLLAILMEMISIGDKMSETEELAISIKGISNRIRALESSESADGNVALGTITLIKVNNQVIPNWAFPWVHTPVEWDTSILNTSQLTWNVAEPTKIRLNASSPTGRLIIEGRTNFSGGGGAGYFVNTIYVYKNDDTLRGILYLASSSNTGTGVICPATVIYNYVAPDDYLVLAVAQTTGVGVDLYGTVISPDTIIETELSMYLLK